MIFLHYTNPLLIVHYNHPYNNHNLHSHNFLYNYYFYWMLKDAFNNVTRIILNSSPFKYDYWIELCEDSSYCDVWDIPHIMANFLN